MANEVEKFMDFSSSVWSNLQSKRTEYTSLLYPSCRDLSSLLKLSIYGVDACDRLTFSLTKWCCDGGKTANIFPKSYATAFVLTTPDLCTVFAVSFRCRQRWFETRRSGRCDFRIASTFSGSIKIPWKGIWMKGLICGAPGICLYRLLHRVKHMSNPLISLILDRVNRWLEINNSNLSHWQTADADELIVARPISFWWYCHCFLL